MAAKSRRTSGKVHSMLQLNVRGLKTQTDFSKTLQKKINCCKMNISNIKSQKLPLFWSSHNVCVCLQSNRLNHGISKPHDDVWSQKVNMLNEPIDSNSSHRTEHDHRNCHGCSRAAPPTYPKAPVHCNTDQCHQISKVWGSIN